MLFRLTPRADVRDAFVPLIQRAEEAGWTREVEQLRGVVEVGSILPTFWRDFVMVSTNMVATRRRVVMRLSAIDRETAEQMVRVIRDLPGDLCQHAGSLSMLLAYLQGSADLYTEAVALGLRFGGCGSA